MTARELFEALEKIGKADEWLCVYDDENNHWVCIDGYEVEDNADGVLLK